MGSSHRTGSEAGLVFLAKAGLSLLLGTLGLGLDALFAWGIAWWIIYIIAFAIVFLGDEVFDLSDL